MHGQIYDMGRSYPQVIRENVLDLHNNGLSIREIGAQARVSNGFITKVLKEYNERNYSIPQKALCGRKNSILTENVRSYLEVEKLNQASIYSYELQKRLLLDGVCLPAEIPSQSSITKYLHKDLGMTMKKIPFESMSGPNVQRQNEFLDEISRIDPCTLQFFDATSVI